MNSFKVAFVIAVAIIVVCAVWGGKKFKIVHVLYD